ncbi:MAG TPA: D-aminoacyl-tRNA deacylase [Thermoplasmata archaeon]|nr:D-aminoacyl-tRNA deacylase [Thermoplasmata archaeon]
MSAELLVLVYESDPVAREVGRLWGTLPADGPHVDGAPVRRLSESVRVLRRDGVHIHDEELDRRLPAALLAGSPTLVFPSIHRSEQKVASLTVHPIGNPGPTAELGGRPRHLVPTDPLRMVSALRLLQEGSSRMGVPSTYEATHHGPALDTPSFFIEVGSGAELPPPPEAVRILADVIPRITETSGDRVALAVGGGHYVPHFTDLALHRSWAFGHLLSRHALEGLDRATARAAFNQSRGAEGIVYSRAQDARRPALEGIASRLRDQDAPGRTRDDAPTTGASRSASGT